MGGKESKPAAAKEFKAENNRKWILKRRPHKTVKYGDLEVEVDNKPSCGDGEVSRPLHAVLTRIIRRSTTPANKISTAEAPRNLILVVYFSSKRQSCIFLHV
jgi:hypothetical protein